MPLTADSKESLIVQAMEKILNEVERQVRICIKMSEKKQALIDNISARFNAIQSKESFINSCKEDIMSIAQAQQISDESINADAEAYYNDVVIGRLKTAQSQFSAAFPETAAASGHSSSPNLGKQNVEEQQREEYKKILLTRLHLIINNMNETINYSDQFAKLLGSADLFLGPEDCSELLRMMLKKINENYVTVLLFKNGYSLLSIFIDKVKLQPKDSVVLVEYLFRQMGSFILSSDVDIALDYVATWSKKYPETHTEIAKKIKNILLLGNVALFDRCLNKDYPDTLKELVKQDMISYVLNYDATDSSSDSLERRQELVSIIISQKQLYKVPESEVLQNCAINKAIKNGQFYLLSCYVDDSDAYESIKEHKNYKTAIIAASKVNYDSYQKASYAKEFLQSLFWYRKCPIAQDPVILKEIRSNLLKSSSTRQKGSCGYDVVLYIEKKLHSRGQINISEIKQEIKDVSERLLNSEGPNILYANSTRLADAVKPTKYLFDTINQMQNETLAAWKTTKLGTLIRGLAPFYKPASLKKERTHFFPAHALNGCTEKGDALKIKILLGVQHKLKECNTVNNLSSFKTDFIKTPEYKVLCLGQGITTKLFRLNTSSKKAFDSLCNQREKELQDLQPSTRLGF